MKKSLLLLLTSASLAFATPAFAADEGVIMDADGFINEIRGGVVWAQPDWLDSGHPEDDQFAITAQILLNPFSLDFFGATDGSESNFVKSLLNPRPTIGATLNLDDDGTDYVHAGLVWHFAVTQTFFVEAGFGGAWNNGRDNATPTRAGIGSDFVFNESIALGANLTENLTFLIQVDHLSHADLGSNSNRGLTNFSARLGYKF